MHADQPRNGRVAYTITTSGSEPDRFFAELSARGVEVLLDVRPTPRADAMWARPAALADAAFERGIRVVRMPELVPPAHIAHPSDGDSTWVTFRDAYIDHLTRNIVSFRRLKQHVESARVALLCDCVDPRRCHRGILTERLVTSGVPSTHLYPVFGRATAVENVA